MSPFIDYLLVALAAADPAPGILFPGLHRLLQLQAGSCVLALCRADTGGNAEQNRQADCWEFVIIISE